jgi:hypothetical protein
MVCLEFIITCFFACSLRTSKKLEDALCHTVTYYELFEYIYYDCIASYYLTHMQVPFRPNLLYFHLKNLYLRIFKKSENTISELHMLFRPSEDFHVEISLVTACQRG